MSGTTGPRAAMTNLVKLPLRAIPICVWQRKPCAADGGNDNGIRKRAQPGFHWTYFGIRPTSMQNPRPISGGQAIYDFAVVRVQSIQSETTLTYGDVGKARLGLSPR